MQPVFHWLTLGFGIDGFFFSYFVLGVMQMFAFLDTNICWYPKREIGVGGLSQCEDPIAMQMILPRSGI